MAGYCECSQSRPGAKNVVEIGTYNGYSALWFCLALRATGGKIITHEIDVKIAAVARENFKKAGVENLATVVEGDAHDTVTKLKGPIDILLLTLTNQAMQTMLRSCCP